MGDMGTKSAVWQPPCVCVCTPTLQVSEREPQTPDVRKLRHLHFEVGKASQVFALLSTLLGNWQCWQHCPELAALEQQRGLLLQFDCPRHACGKRRGAKPHQLRVCHGRLRKNLPRVRVTDTFWQEVLLDAAGSATRCLGKPSLAYRNGYNMFDCSSRDSWTLVEWFGGKTDELS